MEDIVEIQELARQLRAAIAAMPQSRESSLAMTKVDEALMWAKEASVVRFIKQGAMR